MSRRPLVRDREAAKWLGIGAVIAGAVLLHDAYERRDRPRPRAFKLFGLLP